VIETVSGSVNPEPTTVKRVNHKFSLVHLLNFLLSFLLADRPKRVFDKDGMPRITLPKKLTMPEYERPNGQLAKSPKDEGEADR